MAVIFLKLRHRNRIDARKKWGPIRRGGGFAPYERFRLWRKPWRRANSFCPSILITEGWSRLSGGGTQKERLASGVSFFLVDPRRIELPNLSDANQPSKLFLIISGHFWLFPLRSTSSLGLFDHAVSMWSGTVCGRLCGQKRSPALADVFRRQGRGAFFMPLTACIVPLSTGLSKSFLCRPQLRNWGTGNKKRHFAFEDEETLQSVQAAAQTT